jgi:hypothetical protein
MSAGSEASNLGYGRIFPLSNINGQYVNTYNTNNPANFGSNETNRCLQRGGKHPTMKQLRRKIKNIVLQYKMKSHTRTKTQTRFKRTRHNKTSRRTSRRVIRRTKRLRGGYSQYQNNLPMTPTYGVAGVPLSSSDLALANPPPITTLSNCVNCVDNYNHYTNQGFPSRGH